jgi:hypothetical protein
MASMNAKGKGLPEIIGKRLPRAHRPVAQPRLKGVVASGTDRANEAPVSQLQVEIILSSRRQGISFVELVQIRRKIQLMQLELLHWESAKIQLTAPHEDHLLRLGHHQGRRRSRRSVKTKPQVQSQGKEWQNTQGNPQGNPNKTILNETRGMYIEPIA